MRKIGNVGFLFVMAFIAILAGTTFLVGSHANELVSQDERCAEEGGRITYFPSKHPLKFYCTTSRGHRPLEM